MSIRCWDELLKYGVNDILKREYGAMLRAQPEPEYNVSLDIDLEQFPPEGGMYPSISILRPSSHPTERTTRCTHQVNRSHQT